MEGRSGARGRELELSSCGLALFIHLHIGCGLSGHLSFLLDIGTVAFGSSWAFMAQLPLGLGLLFFKSSLKNPLEDLIPLA